MGGRQRTIAPAAVGGLLVVVGIAVPVTAADRPAPGERIFYLEFDGSTGGSRALTTGQAGPGLGVRLLRASSADHSPEGTRVACVRENTIRGSAITKQTVSIGPRE